MAVNIIKNCFIFVLILCLSLALPFAGCEEKPHPNQQVQKFEIDKTFERGPLNIHLRLSKGEITIADTLILEFETAIQPGYKVEMPKIDELLKNFGILDWNSSGDKLDENNNLVNICRYRLEPFLSGSYTLPAFKFEFYDVNDPNNQRYELLTEPIEVKVTSLLGDQRSKLVIADIENVVEMPRQTSYRWVWVITGAAVVAAVALWFGLRKKRNIKLVRIFKPAHEIAYDRLRILVGKDLIKAGKIKQFYERISDILRHYIEHRFDLRAPERTTEEFLTELKFTELLSSDNKADLEEFLRHCDLVKFAKYNPTSEQIQQTFDLVKNFIDETKSDERKIDVTDKIDSVHPVTVGSE